MSVTKDNIGNQVNDLGELNLRQGHEHFCNCDVQKDQLIVSIDPDTIHPQGRLNLDSLQFVYAQFDEEIIKCREDVTYYSDDYNEVVIEAFRYNTD